MSVGFALKSSLKKILPERIVNTIRKGKLLVCLLNDILKSKVDSDVTTYLTNNAPKTPIYSDDGLTTFHLCDFLKDKKFMNAYSNSVKNNELYPHPGHIHYRAYVVSYFASQALQTEGDFIEIGTGRGIMAGTIFGCTELSKYNKKFYLCDSFEGIPTEKLKDQELEHAKKLNSTHYSSSYYDFVKKKFSNYKNAIVVKGFLPDSLLSLDLNKIAFLHIDLNNAISEIESMEVLYDKLSVGACVVYDDYAYSEEYRAQKDAWDNYMKKKNRTILSLPTGQGLFIR